MKINAFKMLPFAKELLNFLQEGVQDGSIIWNDLKPTIDEDMIREKIAEKIAVKMVYWQPQYDGKELLDEATRKAGARFLAGVVINLVKD